MLIICKLFVIYHWVELQADYSPRKIYDYISSDDPTVLEINSFGKWIYCHSNCSHMFEGFSNVQNFQWTQNVIFKTDDVTDMSYMFAGCSSMNTLPNITSFNTTNVTNMAHMFEGCSVMTGLELPFNTHHLRGDGMVAMFKNCSRLQTLTLNLFTTEQITDMTELFYGCSSMDTLFINQFVISNNSTLTNMCKLLSNGHTAHWRGAIICTGDVQTALLKRQFVATNDDENITYYSDENDEDDDPNTLYYYYITGINPDKISFPTLAK